MIASTVFTFNVYQSNVTSVIFRDESDFYSRFVKKQYLIIYFGVENWSKNAHMGFKSIRG